MIVNKNQIELKNKLDFFSNSINYFQSSFKFNQNLNNLLIKLNRNSKNQNLIRMIVKLN